MLGGGNHAVKVGGKRWGGGEGKKGNKHHTRKHRKPVKKGKKKKDWDTYRKETSTGVILEEGRLIFLDKKGKFNATMGDEYRVHKGGMIISCNSPAFGGKKEDC